ncbi:MAG TPA: hypothetical protein GX708_17595, partial [Gallicola sp.]|nr:hypothetical protein [Gallicola sp.]
DGLVALLETNDDNNVVDTIGEILAIFQNYPEGAELVTILQGKVDKVVGKGLSENDLTDELKDNYDVAYTHSQIVGANPHQTTYAQLLDKPTTIEQAGILNVYNKEYIDSLKDKNGWESELLGTLASDGKIALSIINQYDEIQMYAKDTLGVIDNENIRPSLMQSGDIVYFFDDTQAFMMIDTHFSFYAPVGYTLQVVGLKYTDLDAHNIRFNGSGTNYLVNRLDVESAVKELDTRVKANADDKVDKQQLRGYNFAMPDLSSATDLGDGTYRIYDDNGITIDYNVNNGIWNINGTPDNNFFINLANNITLGQLTAQMIVISGSATTTSDSWRFTSNDTNEGRIYLDGSHGGYIKTYVKINNIDNLRFNIREGSSFNNYQFKLQLEKGDTATPYTVPGQIPQYKLKGENPNIYEIGEEMDTHKTNLLPHVLENLEEDTMPRYGYNMDTTGNLNMILEKDIDTVIYTDENEVKWAYGDIWGGNTNTPPKVSKFVMKGTTNFSLVQISTNTVCVYFNWDQYDISSPAQHINNYGLSDFDYNTLANTDIEGIALRKVAQQRILLRLNKSRFIGWDDEADVNVNRALMNNYFANKNFVLFTKLPSYEMQPSIKKLEKWLEEYETIIDNGKIENIITIKESNIIQKVKHKVLFVPNPDIPEYAMDAPQSFQGEGILFEETSWEKFVENSKEWVNEFDVLLIHRASTVLDHLCKVSAQDVVDELLYWKSKRKKFIYVTNSNLAEFTKLNADGSVIETVSFKQSIVPYSSGSSDLPSTAKDIIDNSNGLFGDFNILNRPNLNLKAYANRFIYNYYDALPIITTSDGTNTNVLAIYKPYDYCVVESAGMIPGEYINSPLYKYINFGVLVKHMVGNNTPIQLSTDCLFSKKIVASGIDNDKTDDLPAINAIIKGYNGRKLEIGNVSSKMNEELAGWYTSRYSNIELVSHSRTHYGSNTVLRDEESYVIPDNQTIILKFPFRVILISVVIGGTPLTKKGFMEAITTNQYGNDEFSGILKFHSSRIGQTVNIQYRSLKEYDEWVNSLQELKENGVLTDNVMYLTGGKSSVSASTYLYCLRNNIALCEHTNGNARIYELLKEKTIDKMPLIHGTFNFDGFKKWEDLISLGYTNEEILDTEAPKTIENNIIRKLPFVWYGHDFSLSETKPNGLYLNPNVDSSWKKNNYGEFIEYATQSLDDYLKLFDAINPIYITRSAYCRFFDYINRYVDYDV